MWSPAASFRYFFSLLKSNLNSFFLLNFLIKKLTILKYLEFHKIKSKQVFVTDIVKLVCVLKMNQNIFLSSHSFSFLNTVDCKREGSCLNLFTLAIVISTLGNRNRYLWCLVYLKLIECVRLWNPAIYLISVNCFFHWEKWKDGEDADS